MDGIVCLYPRLAVNLTVGPACTSTDLFVFRSTPEIPFNSHAYGVRTLYSVQAQSQVINPASHFRTELTKKDRCRAGPM